MANLKIKVYESVVLDLLVSPTITEDWKHNIITDDQNVRAKFTVSGLDEIYTAELFNSQTGEDKSMGEMIAGTEKIFINSGGFVTRTAMSLELRIITNSNKIYRSYASVRKPEPLT